MDFVKRKFEILVVFYWFDYIIWYDGEFEKEVGDGYGENEEVGRCVKLFEVGNGNDYG